jgi:RecA-family ATPase
MSNRHDRPGGIKDAHDAHLQGVNIREEADKANVEQAARRANGGAHKTGWRANVFTAADLQNKKFPDVSYVIPGLIPEGLTIFAGRPKIGKSWGALELAIGVAAGLSVFGGVDEVEQGDVLYCALEDNQRRLKRRLTKLLPSMGGVWPKRLTLATQWRRLDQGGVEDIKSWYSSVAKPRLTILDTLAGVRPPRDGKDIYESDYKALWDIHRFTNDNGIASLALHHTRKMEAEDPLDTISGSLGIAGAADTCLVLARTQNGTTLYVRGRDVEEQEHAIAFSKETCRWSILGDATEIRRSTTRKSILEVLAEATTVLNPQEISAATGINRNAVDQRLYKMVKDGEAVQVGRGLYAHPDKAAMLTPHKKGKT